jgi:hypothetical protein
MDLYVEYLICGYVSVIGAALGAWWFKRELETPGGSLYYRCLPFAVTTAFCGSGWMATTWAYSLKPLEERTWFGDAIFNFSYAIGRLIEPHLGTFSFVMPALLIFLAVCLAIKETERNAQQDREKRLAMRRLYAQMRKEFNL